MNRKLIFSGVLILFACNSYSGQTQSVKTRSTKSTVSQSPATASTEQVQKAAVSKQEIEAGKQLISKLDCFACHKRQDKLIGPAYAEVAKKYLLTDANVKVLAQKVIKGGSGVWGKIPMPPHPSIAGADAKKIVKYILSEF